MQSIVTDERLRAVVDPEAPLLRLYGQAIHGEGPAWDPIRHRLIFSDVAGRRLLAWYPDGRVEVVIDATLFINGTPSTPMALFSTANTCVAVSAARGRRDTRAFHRAVRGKAT